jgi:hypothetical protein
LEDESEDNGAPTAEDGGVEGNGPAGGVADPDGSANNANGPDVGDGSDG